MNPLSARLPALSLPIFAVLLASISGVEAVPTTAKPNIIVILADDLG